MKESCMQSGTHWILWDTSGLCIADSEVAFEADVVCGPPLEESSTAASQSGFYQFSTLGFVMYMQLTSVGLSHIYTHMSTHTGCMWWSLAWYSKWSLEVLGLLALVSCHVFDIHTLAGMCASVCIVVCTKTNMHSCYMYIAACISSLYVWGASPSFPQSSAENYTSCLPPSL